MITVSHSFVTFYNKKNFAYFFNIFCINFQTFFTNNNKENFLKLEEQVLTDLAGSYD